jgi:hypothetical protein
METTITKSKSDLTEKQTSKKSAARLAGQIAEPSHSDSLFIGRNHGRLLQWSIRQRKVIKHYGAIMNYDICIARTTSDKKHLFLGDKVGN